MSLEKPTNGEVRLLLSKLPTKFALREAIDTSKEVFNDNSHELILMVKIVPILNKLVSKKMIREWMHEIKDFEAKGDMIKLPFHSYYEKLS